VAFDLCDVLIISRFDLNSYHEHVGNGVPSSISYRIGVDVRDGIVAFHVFCKRYYSDDAIERAKRRASDESEDPDLKVRLCDLWAGAVGQGREGGCHGVVTAK